MSYTPTTWAAGDTVTSAKLNKIEQGIVGNKHPVIRVSNYNNNAKTISTITYNEFITCLQNNILPILIVTENYHAMEIYYLMYTNTYDDTIYLCFRNPELNTIFDFEVEPETGLILLEDETLEEFNSNNDESEDEPIPFDKPDIGEAR